MLNVRPCLLIALVSFACSAQCAEVTSPLLNKADLQFLREMTVAVMDASRVAPMAKVGDIGPNITGGTVIRPGGRGAYPAFWIRDYAMSLASGLVTAEEQRHMLLLTAQHQQDTEWKLPSGSVVTPGSIPDHISFGNKPIFYPGTLEDYEGQGGARWGILPSLDDAYYFIHMAHFYLRGLDEYALLDKVIDDKTLFQRLEDAYTTPPSRGDTKLVYANDENRGVTFGFVDTTWHTGDLLFCSVLKYRAAIQMYDLATAINNVAAAERYRDEAATLQAAITKTFMSDAGLLRASTGKSAQLDVWGSAFAVYVDSVDDATQKRICEALAKAYSAGAIAWKGNIRHVPTDGDFSKKTMWEHSLAAKNRYQNGAYWATPTGWVCHAIAQVDIPLAQQLAHEYVNELRVDDFRKGDEFGAPWECMHEENRHRQNPVYLTSVAAPLAAFQREGE